MFTYFVFLYLCVRYKTVPDRCCLYLVYSCIPNNNIYIYIEFFYCFVVIFVLEYFIMLLVFCFSACFFFFSHNGLSSLSHKLLYFFDYTLLHDHMMRHHHHHHFFDILANWGQRVTHIQTNAISFGNSSMQFIQIIIHIKLLLQNF